MFSFFWEEAEHFVVVVQSLPLSRGIPIRARNTHGRHVISVLRRTKPICGRAIRTSNQRFL